MPKKHFEKHVPLNSYQSAHVNLKLIISSTIKFNWLGSNGKKSFHTHNGNTLLFWDSEVDKWSCCHDWLKKSIEVKHSSQPMKHRRNYSKNSTQSQQNGRTFSSVFKFSAFRSTTGRLKYASMCLDWLVMAMLSLLIGRTDKEQSEISLSFWATMLEWEHVCSSNDTSLRFLLSCRIKGVSWMTTFSKCSERHITYTSNANMHDFSSIHYLFFQ